MSNVLMKGFIFDCDKLVNDKMIKGKETQVKIFFFCQK